MVTPPDRPGPSSGRQDGVTSTRPPAPSSPPVASRAGLITALRVVAVLLTVLVLVQAVIAGQSEQLPYGDWSIAPHGVLGNIALVLAVAGLVLAIVTRAPKVLAAVGGVLVALMTVQIALGYSAGESSAAGAWHVPNGVVIFGLVVYQQALVRRLAAGRD